MKPSMASSAASQRRRRPSTSSAPPTDLPGRPRPTSLYQQQQQTAFDQTAQNPINGTVSPSKTQTGRLKEAVSSVFEQNAPANATNAISPDLIAAITKQVLENIKASGLNNGIVQEAEQPAASTTPPKNAPPSPPGEQLDGLNQRSGEVSEPPPPPAASSDTTTLERIWQPLFDEAGEPTERLGQFLRGLAAHIIRDYEPFNSLVISPHKILRFYEETKVKHELYPWSAMFGGAMTTSSISHLYRDLEVEHVFTQPSRFDEKPCVPCMTPLGFQIWMTHFIRSHPDLEFERFAKAVMEMPVSNADNPKERFPKQLPKALFPQANSNVRLHLRDSIMADPVISLGPENSQTQKAPPPPQLHPSVSAPPTSPLKQNLTRPTYAPNAERSPYPQPSEAVAVEDAPAPPVTIERERKPYYAQPGNGKTYNDDPNALKPPDPNNLTRSNTISSSRPPPPTDTNDERETRSRRYRSGSQLSFAAPQFQSAPLRRKARSPSSSAAYTRSETDMPPSAAYGSASSNDDLQKSHSRDSRRYVPADEMAGRSNYAAAPPPPTRQQGHEEEYRPVRQGSNPPPPSYQYPGPSYRY